MNMRQLQRDESTERELKTEKARINSDRRHLRFVCECVCYVDATEHYHLSDDFSFSRKTVWYLVILIERKIHTHTHTKEFSHL